MFEPQKEALKLFILEVIMRKDVKKLLAKMALCYYIYVKEYKDLMSQLFC